MIDSRSSAAAAAPAAGRTPVRAIALLATLAVTLAALAFGTAAANAALPPLQTGVSYVLPNEEPAVALEHVKATGSQLTQAPVRWSEVAPKDRPASWQPDNPADPNYDWDRIDRWVVATVQNGLTPVLQIRSAPTWVQRCPATVVDTNAPCNPDPAALAAFATAAARRYNGQFGGLPRVQYWQGMNEPNYSLFFNPQYEGGKPVSPILYRALINAFYAAVKAVDPSNLVIAAGLGPLAFPKSTIGPMRFTRLLLCMTGGKRPRPTKGDCEGGVNFDIYDVHPYTSGGPTHAGGGNNVELGDLDRLVKLLRAADRAGRINSVFPRTPLWITEFSWDSKPPDPGGLPMKTLARWAAEALHEAWRAGVHTFFWFSLRDSPTGSAPYGQTLQSGLYFRGATVAEDRPKKRLFEAFRFPFVAYPGKKGLSFWGRTPTSKKGRVVIEALQGERWHTVGTARANKWGIFKGTSKTRYGHNRQGSIRARFRQEASVPFAMRGIPDFPQPPFGGVIGG